MNRLFTFGCSFTKFPWPTWADILGSTAEHYENWGREGAGNFFIFNSVVECNLRNTFTKDDTVIVMWSNVTRCDTYIDNTWFTPGNIFNQEFYSKEFIANYFDIKGYMLRDFSLVAATKALLDDIGCNYHFLSMVDLKDTFNLLSAEAVHIHDSDVPALDENLNDIYNKYKPILDFVKPSVHQVVFNYDWFSRPTDNGIRHDHHPTPLEHYEYLQKVLPQLVDKVSAETYSELEYIDGYARTDSIKKIQSGRPSLYKKYASLYMNEPTRW